MPFAPAAVSVRACCVVGIGNAGAGVEVCACAEHAAVTGHHDGFYAGIGREEGEGCFEGGGHGVCEGVVLAWAV